MKYINEFKHFYENIDWNWNEEDEEPLDYSFIQPYTMVKNNYNNFFFTIGDFIYHNNKKLTHVYPDKIGEVDYIFLYNLSYLNNINKTDLIEILDKKIEFSNGHIDEEKYKFYFDEIYPLMNNNYKNYLNNKFDNILKEYGYE